MATETKKKNQGMSGLTLGRKKALKKSKIDVEKVEKVVKEIHTEKKEPTSKASVTLPRSLYKEMKKRVVEKDTTVTDYFTDLLKKDLGV